MHGRVHAERCVIDAQSREAGVQSLTSHVDLDQVTGRDLAVQQAMWCSQQVLSVLTQSSLVMSKT